MSFDSNQDMDIYDDVETRNDVMVDEDDKAVDEDDNDEDDKMEEEKEEDEKEEEAGEKEDVDEDADKRYWEAKAKEGVHRVSLVISENN
jgi:hypothetical protein